MIRSPFHRQHLASQHVRRSVPDVTRLSKHCLSKAQALAKRPNSAVAKPRRPGVTVIPFAFAALLLWHPAFVSAQVTVSPTGTRTLTVPASTSAYAYFDITNTTGTTQ